MIAKCAKCSNEREVNEQQVCALCQARSEEVQAERSAPADTMIGGGNNVISIDAAKPQAPAVRARLVIILTEDGNMQVDGPFEDRVLYHGLLAMAADVERNMADDRRRRALRDLARPPVKESIRQRIARQFAERAARKKQEQEQKEKEAKSAGPGGPEPERSAAN